LEVHTELVWHVLEGCTVDAAKGILVGQLMTKVPQGYGQQGSNIVNVHCNHVAVGYEPTNSFSGALEASKHVLVQFQTGFRQRKE
jgi:hypothetical protein